MSQLDIENYRNTGIGLSRNCFINIKKILDNMDNIDNINILEFGSGNSTNFFVDYKLYTNKNIYIDSFDDSHKYCYKNTNNYNFVNINICQIITCSESDFNNMFSEKTYNHNVFKKYEHIPGANLWRPRNCFYDLSKIDFNKKYDIVVIDGPHGNGRNIAYLHIKNILNPNAFIIVDDYNARDNEFDYKFIEYLKEILPVKEIYTHTYKSHGDEWENGGNFALYQLI